MYVIFAAAVCYILRQRVYEYTGSSKCHYTNNQISSSVADTVYAAKISIATLYTYLLPH